MAQIIARLFGGFELSDAGGVELKPSTRKTQGLLAFLILEPGRWHSRDRLSGLLWSDRQQSHARHSLTQAVSTIRKLGDQVSVNLTETERERVRLLGDGVSADTTLFRKKLEDSCAGAAQLYTGPLLDGMPALDPVFDEWLLTQRAKFHELVCTALERAIGEAEVNGDLASGIANAKRWITLDPYAEPAHRRLIGLLAASGDRPEAIRHYQVCAKLLMDELGIEPSKETRSLVEDIRGHLETAAFPVHSGSNHSATSNAPSLPDRPSIAVLPFKNMSADPEQEFLAEGIAEDVTTALSRFSSLFVIARSSSFTYKGSAVGIRQIGRELGVRYVVEGSVRRLGDRIRITAQLIDATKDNYVWSDQFDGTLAEIFELQDQVTEKIVVAVEPEIQAREIERLRRVSPQNFSAWEILQQALSYLQRVDETDRAKAIELLNDATDLDPGLAAAHAQLAYTLCASRSMTLIENEDLAAALNAARIAAQKALTLDPNEPMAHYALGRVHMFTGEAEMAIAEMQIAATINSNFAQGHYGLGWANYYSMGQLEVAIEHLDTALRLSPRNPRRWLPLMIRGSALSMLGHHAEAVKHCREACRYPDRGFMPYMHLAEVLARADQVNGAREATARAIDIQPSFSINFLEQHLINMHEATLSRLLDSLRKADVPDEFAA